MLTLEEYFKLEASRGTVDFSLRAMVHDGRVEFYIHPTGKDGLTTPPYVVTDNTVSLKPGVVAEGWR